MLDSIAQHARCALLLVLEDHTSRVDALQHAWFNGVGFVAWENVWGIWNGLTPRDGAALHRLQVRRRGVTRC